MPGERLSMRKIREVLRLRLEQRLTTAGYRHNSLRLSQGAVNGYLSRARRAGLDVAVAGRARRRTARGTAVSAAAGVPSDQRPVPDWAVVHRDLRRPNVTLSLLWEEYRGGDRARTGSATPGSAICIANGSAG